MNCTRVTLMVWIDLTVRDTCEIRTDTYVDFDIFEMNKKNI